MPLKDPTRLSGALRWTRVPSSVHSGKRSWCALLSEGQGAVFRLRLEGPLRQSVCTRISEPRPSPLRAQPAVCLVLANGVKCEPELETPTGVSFFFSFPAPSPRPVQDCVTLYIGHLKNGASLNQADL